MQGLKALPLVKPGPMRVPHATPPPSYTALSALPDLAVFYGLIIHHRIEKVTE